MLILVIWWWLLLELLRRGICLPDVPGCDSEIFEHFLEGLNISPPSIYISKARPCSLRWWSSVQTDRLVCTADVVLYQHSLTLCILRAVSQEKLKAPTHNFTELSPGPALISHLLDEIRWGSVPGPLQEIPTSHLWTAKDSNLGRSLRESQGRMAESPSSGSSVLEKNLPEANDDLEVQSGPAVLSQISEEALGTLVSSLVVFVWVCWLFKDLVKSQCLWWVKRYTQHQEIVSKD